MEVALEVGVGRRPGVFAVELVEGGDERLGDVAAPVGAETAGGIGDGGEKGHGGLIAAANYQARAAGATGQGCKSRARSGFAPANPRSKRAAPHLLKIHARFTPQRTDTWTRAPSP